eukprot:TRINITY_DN1763_c0_g1_i2.p1 TRINITY_DN1763_c0_g1~~TRINITY_DN1763_c0_g1_i2.p1  ORF type:complete len:238 (+),score=48.07 TRINITY_DN1763_c0_g1_i2:58-714(+)
MMASRGGKFYPYRDVLHEATKILKERGYNVINKQVTDGKTENWQLYSGAEELYREYLGILRNTKIFLTTSSTCGYMVGKYGEAMSSGALLFGTVPDEMPGIWEHVMAVIPHDLSAEVIANDIESLLADDERRIDIAGRGQEFAHTKLEVDQLGGYLRKLFVDWKCWEVRGTLYLPYPFMYRQNMYFPGSHKLIHLGAEYDEIFGAANKDFQLRCPLEP